MNKSKILKRSLAVILAMMMIFAMIPLSASAADAPTITAVTVKADGTEFKATLSGSDYQAELSATAVAGTIEAYVTLAGGIGKVYHANDGTGGVIAQENGRFKLTFSDPEKAAKKLSFDLYDTDTVKVATYTISFTVAALDRDTGVDSVTVAGQYGATVLDGNTYTIVVPYNSASATVTVKPTSAKASVTEGFTGKNNGTWTKNFEISSTPQPFKVVSEGNVSSKTYYVKVIKAEAFTSFSVDGQRLDADILPGATAEQVSAKGFAGYNSEGKAGAIVVHLPYGTETTSAGSFAFTPTFTTGYDSVSISYKNGTKTLTSGEEADLKDMAGIAVSQRVQYAGSLTLTYTQNVTEQWALIFETPEKNPEAEITSAKYGNFVGEVDEDSRTITLALPADVRTKAHGELTLGVSTGSTVQLVGVDAGEVVNQDDKLVKNFADGLTADTYILRVTAGQREIGASAEAVKDYTLKVVTQDAKPAAITKAILQDADGNNYEATIGSDYTVNFVLPFKFNNNAKIDAEKFKLFYEITSGSEIYSEVGGAIGETGAVVATARNLIWPQADGKFLTTAAAGGTKKVWVETSQTNRHAYTFTIKLDAASVEAELSDLVLVRNDITALANVSASNSYEVSGTKDFVVTIPARDYRDYTTETHYAKIIGEISEGAKLYYVGAGGVLNEMTLSDGNGGFGSAALPWDPTTEGTKYDGTANADGSVTKLNLVVVSEGVDVANETKFEDAFKMANNGLFKTYTLTVKEGEAHANNSIKTVSLYDPIFEETVTATASAYGFTLKIPYHFTNNYNPFGSMLNDPDPNGGHVAVRLGHTLYLSYESDNYESVFAGTDTELSDRIKPLEFDSDGVVVEETGLPVSVDYDPATGTATLNYGNMLMALNIGDDITRLHSKSENELSEQDWTLTVEVEKPEIGAELESVTINGVTAKPDANNKVSINLPFGTEITHLLPELKLSKNAIALINTDNPQGLQDIVHINGKSSYNLTTPVKFSIVSEDGNHETEYTLSVTLADQFTDVDPNKWYYSEIMEAVKKGITVGNGNGTFGPNTPVTRGQFAQFLARADGYNAEDYTDKSVFSDVPAGNEQAAAIAYCAEKKYINGFGDTTFKPSAYITREQIATILAQFLGLEKIDKPTELFADDAQIAGWAKGWVYAVADAKIMVGKGDNFDPKGNATRAEACAVCVRVTK